MIEFYAGFLTGVVFATIWFASRRNIIAVNEGDMTASYNKRCYHLKEVEKHE